MENKGFNEDEQARKLFRKLERERTSADFTSNVMDKIAALEARKHQALEYKPIISLKAWIAIAAAFIGAIVLFSLTGAGAAAESPYAGYIEKGNEFLGSLFAGAEISPIILITIFAFWGLFFLDKIMSKLARV